LEGDEKMGQRQKKLQRGKIKKRKLLTFLIYSQNSLVSVAGGARWYHPPGMMKVIREYLSVLGRLTIYFIMLMVVIYDSRIERKEHENRAKRNPRIE
jgi:hypothetical protein